VPVAPGVPVMPLVKGILLAEEALVKSGDCVLAVGLGVAMLLWGLRTLGILLTKVYLKKHVVRNVLTCQ
jgi:hypothetical protein